MRKALYSILPVLFLLASCTALVPVSETGLNLASLYNPSRNSLHPDFSVFNEDAESSTLFMRVYPQEFMFSQANTEAELRAVMELDYRLFSIVPDSGFALVDTATIRSKLTAADKAKKAWMISIRIPAEDGHKYLLQLVLKDLQRGTVGFEQVLLDKSSTLTAQNFKIVSAYSGYPKFMNFLLPGEMFYLQYRNKDVDSVIVDYYSRAHELPRPPLNSLAEYHLMESPDTTILLPLSDTSTFSLKKSGRYLFRTDPSKYTGLSLFCFGSDFPYIKTADALLEPLFYLTTLTEYRDLRRKVNRKLAVDDFWLGCGNSIERSRELIRVYYNRAYYANLFFSTDREGWKTDRGMMLILLGPPDKVNIKNTDEVWYYSSRKRGKVYELVFQLDISGPAGVDYIWKRTPDGWSVWNEAVRSWRGGKVFTLSD